VEAIADWARKRGLAELASDATRANRASHRMHRALGFVVTDRAVFFCRTIAKQSRVPSE
jgi:aminoglycoside 6'-N-acetyltransferase I